MPCGYGVGIRVGLGALAQWLRRVDYVQNNLGLGLDLHCCVVVLGSEESWMSYQHDIE